MPESEQLPQPEPPVEPLHAPMEPLDPPMVPFAVAGTAIWAVVGLVLLVLGAPDGWLWTCLAGVGIGLVFTTLMVVRDRRHRDDHRQRDNGRDRDNGRGRDLGRDPPS